MPLHYSDVVQDLIIGIDLRMYIDVHVFCLLKDVLFI